MAMYEGIQLVAHLGDAGWVVVKADGSDDIFEVVEKAAK